MKSIIPVLVYLTILVQDGHSNRSKDAVIRTRNMLHVIHKRSIEKGTKLWTNGEVPYVIDPRIPAYRVNVIKRAFEEFKHWTTCIKIIPWTNQENFVFIRTANEGNYSSQVGMKGGEQILDFGGGGTLSYFMHEFMHVLGFMHEQEREDRDRYITVHMENMDLKRAEDFQQRALSTKSVLDDKFKNFPYDYRSLMHYPQDSGAKYGTKMITINDPKFKNLENLLGNEAGFSTCDIYKINFAYGCRSYTEEERKDLCFSNVHRIGAISCPRNDPYQWCQNASKNMNLCNSNPGNYLIKCPLACNNCEGVCYNSINDEDQIICKRIDEKTLNNGNGKYQCDAKELVICPISCGVC